MLQWLPFGRRRYEVLMLQASDTHLRSAVQFEEKANSLPPAWHNEAMLYMANAQLQATYAILAAIQGLPRG